jgi:hypothetical protein
MEVNDRFAIRSTAGPDPIRSSVYAGRQAVVASLRSFDSTLLTSKSSANPTVTEIHYGI